MCIGDVTRSKTGFGSRGLKLDDGLRKSTECLASISPDATLAPASLDRAASQPNLLALLSQDTGLSDPIGDLRGKSPIKRHRETQSVTDDDDVAASNFPRQIAKSGSDPKFKSPSQRHMAKSSNRGPEADTDHEASASYDATSDKLAVIDRTLAKVMSGLRTLDNIDQDSQDLVDNLGTSAAKNPEVEDTQQATTAVSVTVPITVKTSSTRDDRSGGGPSSFGSFCKTKSATLPKSVSSEKIAAESDAQPKPSDSVHSDVASEADRQSQRSSLSRSDSAPQKKDGSHSAAFPLNPRTTRAIPAATPVVPNVPSGAPTASHGGAPTVPPKPSTARKPTAYGSPKTTRVVDDGKMGGGGGGKLGKK